MKKLTIIATSLLLVLSFSAHAKKPDGVGKKGEKPAKVDVCHNGSTYLLDTTDVDPELLIGENEMAVSFVINISSAAVNKHIEKHKDCPGLFEQGDEIDVCELDPEADILVCEKKVSCTCLDVEVAL